MARRGRRVPQRYPCPNCGADVVEGAIVCRECGSDAETGWSEETLYDDLDLPTPFEDVELRESKPRNRAALIAVLLLIVLWLLMVR